MNVNTLGQDDYQIRSASLDGQAAVLIAGRNDRAAMYGLYAFLEQLGCRFLFSGDVLPDYNPDLAISPLDITGHTDCPWRGTWLGCSFTTIAMMSLVDVVQISHQTGNDHNVGFIADGMWNESLTPEQYYDRFSKTIFGEPALGSSVMR